MASGLEVPWGLAFLPDGSAVVTERDSARVLLLTGEGEEWEVTEVGRVEAAAPEVEGGLLGVAASPDFDADRTLFFYVTAAEDNRIVKAELDGDRLGEPEPVLTGIPRGVIHDGGRLLFGADGHLYASTGEIGDPELAQDRSSLAGKILRITPEGDPAPGNPDPDSPVWSWGHRNVQGLAFDDRGPALGQRVRRQHLGRAEPDPQGRQLRLAADRGPRRGQPRGLGRRAAPTRGPSGDRRGVALGPGLRRRLAVAGRPARHPALAGPGHRRRRGPAARALRRRLRAPPLGRRGPGRFPVDDHLEPRRPRQPRDDDDRILRLTLVALTGTVTARRATRRRVASTDGPRTAIASALVSARPVSQPPVEVISV